MKDCIVSLFWPRKDIVDFFEKHGCTKTEISHLKLEGETALKRHEIVDALFNPRGVAGYKRTVTILSLRWAVRAFGSTAERRNAKVLGAIFAAEEILLIR